MNTKDRGDIAEQHVVTALLEAGKTVLRPVGDNRRYDVVFEDDGRFYRVQCKTARWADNRQSAICFESCSRHWQRSQYRRGYRGEVEYFGVYFPPFRTVYLVPVGECGTAEVSLRVSPTLNGQKARTRDAKAYEISEVLRSSFEPRRD